MILCSVEYWSRSGIDDGYHYTTVVLKYMCVMAIHLMQQPNILNCIKRL